MFTIGDFARHGRVPVRMLRHYDETAAQHGQGTGQGIADDGVDHDVDIADLVLEPARIGAEVVLEFLAGRLPDACLVGEPTWLDLVIAHRGYAIVEVTFTGQAAYSSQATLGVNAVSHLGRLITAVEEHDAGLAADPAHPVAGTGSMMTTVAGGGTSPFVLADTAFAVVERRTVPGETAADTLAEVEVLLEAMRQAGPTVHADASPVLSREAWEFDPASAAGTALSGMLAEALGAATGTFPDRPGHPVLDGISAMGGRRSPDCGVRSGRWRHARGRRVGRPGAGPRLRRRPRRHDSRVLRSRHGIGSTIWMVKVLVCRRFVVGYTLPGRSARALLLIEVMLELPMLRAE